MPDVPVSDDAQVLDPLMARVALEVAIDQLTRRGKEDRPDGGGKAETLSLLEVAEDAVHANDGTSSARRGGSRAPGRFAVLAWLTELDEAIGERTSNRSRSARLRSWAGRMTTADPVTLTRAVTAAEAWVDRARRVTLPRRTLDLRGVTCPACGADTVVEEGSEGEPVVSVAMFADLATGWLWCAAAGCGQGWPVEAWQGLAAHLDQQTTVEHLAVE